MADALLLAMGDLQKVHKEVARAKTRIRRLRKAMREARRMMNPYDSKNMRAIEIINSALDRRG